MHHHHWAFRQSLNVSSTDKPTSAKDRKKALVVYALAGSFVVAFAVTFIIVAITVVAPQTGFPKGFLIPMILVPSLMIVLVVTGLIRVLKVYKQIPSETDEQEESPKEEE